VFHEVENNITLKINAGWKKCSFPKMLFENLVPRKMHLQITTQPQSAAVE